MRLLKLSIVLVLLLGLLGCSGSGTNKEECQTVDGVTTCQGSYEKITDRQVYYLDDIATPAGSPVLVKVFVTAGSISLQVEMTTSDGQVVSGVAEPEVAAILEGLVLVEEPGRVPVVFQPLGDEDILNVTYTISWQNP